VRGTQSAAGADATWGIGEALLLSRDGAVCDPLKRREARDSESKRMWMNVDVRAGCDGEGVGCILAPTTVEVGGGTYVLLLGLEIHEAPEMPDELVVVLGAAAASRGSNLSKAPRLPTAKRSRGFSR
jgi:hypothetical protein